MSDDFEAFNDRVDVAEGTDTSEDDTTAGGDVDTDDAHDTEVSDVSVVGDDADRLELRAEGPDGSEVSQEMSADEAERVMNLLGVTDARDLEGQPVLVWQEDGENHLDFESETA